MGELLDLIQGHRDKYGVSEAEFSRRIGSSPQTVWAWRVRGIKALPQRKQLEGVSNVTGIPYDKVLRAALADAGYVGDRTDNIRALRPPKQPVDVDAKAARTPIDGFEGGRSHADTDALGEESQDPGSDEPR